MLIEWLKDTYNANNHIKLSIKKWNNKKISTMHEEQISSGTTMIHVSGVCINFSVCFMKTR